MQIQILDIIPRYKLVPARKMNLNAMEQDFTYSIAQKITDRMLEEALITAREYDIITQLNKENFVPFLSGIL